MVDKKADEVRSINENLTHHPIYNECSYENLIPLKFIGFLLNNFLNLLN